jgi:predicted DNA repair protein MutK
MAFLVKRSLMAVFTSQPVFVAGEVLMQGLLSLTPHQAFLTIVTPDHLYPTAKITGLFHAVTSCVNALIAATITSWVPVIWYNSG